MPGQACDDAGILQQKKLEAGFRTLLQYPREDFSWAKKSKHLCVVIDLPVRCFDGNLASTGTEISSRYKKSINTLSGPSFGEKGVSHILRRQRPD